MQVSQFASYCHEAMVLKLTHKDGIQRVGKESKSSSILQAKNK
jgi:hypothetical protein